MTRTTDVPAPPGTTAARPAAGPTSAVGQSTGRSTLARPAVQLPPGSRNCLPCDPDSCFTPTKLKPGQRPPQSPPPSAAGPDDLVDKIKHAAGCEGQVSSYVEVGRTAMTELDAVGLRGTSTGDTAAG